MNTEKKDGPVFNLGICMAGAVSAGAYTAGVMDFLLEALTAYEKVRGTPGYPCHKIEIPAIGGASAGGMTAIIAAAALQQGIQPIDKPGKDILAERPENILYHSWVDLTDVDMFNKMLHNSDIKGSVLSAFNCTFIDEVARRALSPGDTEQPLWQELPPFIPNRLKLFTTLSNLEGFNYNVNFKSADPLTLSRRYNMKFHNDYACFEMNRGGLEPEEGWMKLDIKAQTNAGIAKQAAMATGAFPIGLKARTVIRPREAVAHNPLVDRNLLKAIDITDDAYQSLNVDGGMINNEPFDKVRSLLNSVTNEDEETRTYERDTEFKSTVLMIAPFPSTKPEAIDQSDRLLNVIGRTFSAMISQMRSKPWEVRNSLDGSCYGQFVVDPSRKFPKKDKHGRDLLDEHQQPVMESIIGEKAIACGALGGFSGFLKKEFRVHDYFLGRHNCKIFLKEYFTITDEALKKNAIFREGYSGLSPDEISRYAAGDGKWQIIPIVGNVDTSFPKIPFDDHNDWPKQADADIDQFNDALKSRIEGIIMNMIPLNFWQRLFVWPGVHLFIRRWAARGILKTIKAELRTWKLLPIERN